MSHHQVIDSTQKWLIGSALALIPIVMTWLPSKAVLGAFNWTFLGVILMGVTLLLSIVNVAHRVERHHEDSKPLDGLWT